MTFAHLPLLESVEDASRGNQKIPQSEFLSSGSLAVVDQGQALVAGYTNEVSAAVTTEPPVIVFGDHTRAIKFVDFPFAMGADGVKVLRVREGFDPKFVFHYLASREIPSAGYSRHFKFLKELSVPKPSLPEQRRIATILDHADALRAKRRQVLAHLDDLTQSIFYDMFGASDAGSARLSDIATVTSGITKGRKTSSPTRATPYLAVANVQAGGLKLDVVKRIEATEAEIERYALRHGDLVLTEGGDPDKLGRGTVWRSELPLCLHQNHIFRVRVQDGVLPDYLASYLSSPVARSHFMRSAKQTTGIASINMTQLKATPVVAPPFERQEEFVDRVHAARKLVSANSRAVLADDELFASLQSRAFKGEL